MPICSADASSMQMDAAPDADDGMKLHGHYSRDFGEVRRNSDRRSRAIVTWRKYSPGCEV
jgi:hypothetical protein